MDLLCFSFVCFVTGESIIGSLHFHRSIINNHMDSGKKASQSLYFNKNYKSPYTKLKKYNIKIELCVATSNSE